jgi:hypothetical protein
MICFQLESADAPEPLSFLSWNANGLARRCETPEDIGGFMNVVKIHDPAS